MEMKVTVGKGKRAQVWTVKTFWTDGTPIDLNNPEDKRKLNAAHIKAMESIGYKIQNPEAAAS